MINCKRCNHIFASIRDEIYCANCQEIEKKTLESIKAYLYSNPKSNAIGIAKATNVPISKVLNYIRDGNLGFSD